MSTSIPELSTVLQELLIEKANELGRSSGFIKRQRKITGSSFAKTVVGGWLANSQASLEELSQSAQVAGVKISPQGLQERLKSPEAHQFLSCLLTQSLHYVIKNSEGGENLLQKFDGIYIQDSSKIHLPSSLSAIWPGNGKNQASLKIQTCFNYQQGQLHLTLAAGRRHDCALQETEFPPRSLRLGDVGYFKVQVFKELNEQGVGWVSRLPARAGIYEEGGVIHIAKWLANQEGDQIEQMVLLTAQKLPCRLVAVRVPPEVAVKREAQVREAAKARRHSQLQAATLELCQWTVIVTNLTDLTIPELLTLLRLRWQIELLFKLWKQDLRLDEWRSQNPYQILSELYAKLLIIVIQHWFLVVGCWEESNRSLVKACVVLRKHAFHWLSVVDDFEDLLAVLEFILPTLKRCKIQKRKARPATFQLLDLAYLLT